ncbi:site-2 protease family protein [Halovenus marina]|uniref:site-2 protease family protein n=1 Tax=Halovenus marina TaxID=3396621 RepID=UPI003F549F31
MPDLLTWILVGILLYTVLVMALDRQGYLPGYVNVSGPFHTIKTKRGRILLDRLARPKRFWRAWGNVGVGLTLMIMVLMGLFMALVVAITLTQPDASGIENPQNALIIPGVNEFLPPSAAPEIIFGLVVGLVVHEGGHGLLCRVEDIDIDSMGIAMFAFIPLGAFVEPDANDQLAADRGAQTRMFAAGIMNNLVVTVVALLLLMAVASTVVVVPGAPVGDTFSGSGAADGDLEYGDVITAINGTAVEDAEELESVLADTRSDRVRVNLRDGDPVVVDRRLLVVRAVTGIADGLFAGDEPIRIQAVDGTPVQTGQDFARAVEGAERPELTTTNGTARVPIGAFVAEVDPDGAFADAGAPTDGTPLVITRIDGERVSNTTDLQRVADRLEPGETVSVTAYVEDDADPTQFDNVTLGGDDEAVFGVVLQEGFGGLVLDDFGVDTYPAENILSTLDGTNAWAENGLILGAIAYLGSLLFLPLRSLADPSIHYNFAGFTPDVVGFFAIDGSLAGIGGAVFLLANLLFWTWWINFNLALFNCIPAFPLDGGHILRTSTEAVVSRLPIGHQRTVVTIITIGVTLAMGGALVLMLVGPVFL